MNEFGNYDFKGNLRQNDFIKIIKNLLKNDFCISIGFNKSKLSDEGYTQYIKHWNKNEYEEILNCVIENKIKIDYILFSSNKRKMTFKNIFFLSNNKLQFLGEKEHLDEVCNLINIKLKDD